MKKLVSICIVFLLILTPSLLMARQDGTAELIMKRVMMDLKKPLRNMDKVAEKNLNTLQPDGSWKDVPYKDDAMTNWLPKSYVRLPWANKRVPRQLRKRSSSRSYLRRWA